MLIRWQHVVTRAQAGSRLDGIVATGICRAAGAEVSKSTVRRVVMAGAVRVDGRVARRPGLLLDTGSRLEALIHLDRLGASDRHAHTALTAADILFEDEDVLAVAKPAGIPTHRGADARRVDMVSLVERWLSSRATGSPYVGVHQRLDRDTSGVLLFAKSARANPGLARAFQDRLAVKVYHALTVVPARHHAPVPEAIGTGSSGDAWTITSLLGTRGTGTRSRVTAAPGGVAARTDLHVMERRALGLLIEARPRTGRRHQVRAHLADHGMPILGDTRYGAPAAGPLAAPRVMLHCSRLELPHPVTGIPLAIECPWPVDFRQAYVRTGGATGKRQDR